MGRGGLRFDNFCSKRVYNRRAKKSLFFGEFCLTSRIFLVSVLLSASVERCFVSRMRDFSFPKAKRKNTVVLKFNNSLSCIFVGFNRLLIRWWCRVEGPMFSPGLEVFRIGIRGENFFLIKGKVCFLANFALLAGFFCIGATIRIGRQMLCLPYAGFFLCLVVTLRVPPLDFETV